MSNPSRVASLWAIDQLKEEMLNKCRKQHKGTYQYGSTNDETFAERELKAEQEKVAVRISKEIEEYAVKKYEKYGVIVVPICHRNSVADRLDVQLKAKKFPGLEKFDSAAAKAVAAYKADIERIEKWHTSALESVAKKEALPELPKMG